MILLRPICASAPLGFAQLIFRQIDALEGLLRQWRCDWRQTKTSPHLPRKGSSRSRCGWRRGRSQIEQLEGLPVGRWPVGWRDGAAAPSAQMN